MKVLVFGAAGMLGQAMLKELRGTQHTALAVDLDDADITKLAQVRELLSTTQPDAVINCAAYTNVDGAESEPERAYAVNGLGARNIAVCSDEVGAHLLHVSTDYVFDGETQEPYGSIYGKSKRLGEWSVQRFCRRFAIIRTAWLFGAGGGNFINAILKRARAGKPLKIVNDQIGSPTYAPHLAHCLRQICDKEALGIFHATGQGHCSWFDLGRKALELTGLDVSVEAITTATLKLPAPRPAFSVLENLHLTLEAIAPLPAWQEGVEAYLGEIGIPSKS
ncbi:MAG: dTDP-4-dehydrorhamnose reductase [Deltaproteobacteria bacterium]|nr:dTDP-4-dehydrorhamnose reductase [Deltaproteobacteria bacterium]